MVTWQKVLGNNMIIFLSPLQICDKEWHYYVINVEFPAVTLFVDGVTYEPYLVTDDWPIHSAKIDTQLTVGACWQGQCMSVYCMCKNIVCNAAFVSGIKWTDIKVSAVNMVGIVYSCDII